VEIFRVIFMRRIIFIQAEFCAPSHQILATPLPVILFFFVPNIVSRGETICPSLMAVRRGHLANGTVRQTDISQYCFMLLRKGAVIAIGRFASYKLRSCCLIVTADKTFSEVLQISGMKCLSAVLLHRVHCLCSSLS